MMWPCIESELLFRLLYLLTFLDSGWLICRDGISAGDEKALSFATPIEFEVEHG